MKNILTLNAISNKIDNVFGIDYNVSDSVDNPVGILVRSFDMHGYDLPSSVLAISRAGAGVNNIPCEDYAKQGVVVFNLRCVKVNVSVGEVRIALFHKSFDNLNKVVNALCGRLDNIGILDVELFAIVKEGFLVELRNFHNGFLFALSALEHFVLTRVTVA